MVLYYLGTEEEVQEACDKVWVNMIRTVAAQGDGTMYLDAPTNSTKAVVASTSDIGLQSVVLFSTTYGRLNKTKGYTECYGTPTQCADNVSLYYAPVPESQYVSGVNCPTAEYDEAWKEEIGIG